MLAQRNAITKLLDNATLQHCRKYAALARFLQ